MIVFRERVEWKREENLTINNKISEYARFAFLIKNQSEESRLVPSAPLQQVNHVVVSHPSAVFVDLKMCVYVVAEWSHYHTNQIINRHNGIKTMKKQIIGARVARYFNELDIKLL